ncbi:MAG: carboxy-S-adenosyl-L-methionine synthase CmoA [Wenzhouxiangellaceae bacterium]
MSRDQLFRSRPGAPFTFDEGVVEVFPDMIERSVPGYRTLLELTPLMVQRAVQPDSRIYDLGCSLGAATRAALRAPGAAQASVVAVDNSSAMVHRFRQALADDTPPAPVQVIEADIRSVPIENASVVMLYFTLQFVPPGDRDALIRRIHAGIRPGGVLLMAEKLCDEQADRHELLDALHLDFKRAQGYSELEIARKRQALEDVLVPEPAARHHARLREAGFVPTVEWFRALNFAAFAAFRPPRP